LFQADPRGRGSQSPWIQTKKRLAGIVLEMIEEQKVLISQLQAYIYG